MTGGIGLVVTSHLRVVIVESTAGIQTLRLAVMTSTGLFTVQSQDIAIMPLDGEMKKTSRRTKTMME